MVKEIPNFKKMYLDCEKIVPEPKLDPLAIANCRVRVRKEYRDFLNHRYYEMADNIHKQLSHLDLEWAKVFKKKNPTAIELADELATIEDLRKF